MSIKAEISAHVANGELHNLQPLLRGAPSIRTTIVSTDVYESVCPPWKDYRLSVFRATLDAFTTGERIAVATAPFDKRATAFLARVHPITDEVWDVRSIDPKPGIRCFGRFAEKDVFVALTWNYREEIDWDDEVERFKIEWVRLFHSLPPLVGANLNDYLSGNYRVV